MTCLPGATSQTPGNRYAPAALLQRRGGRHGGASIMAWLPSLARWTRIAGGRTPPPSGRVFMITLQCACAVWSVAERQHGTEGGRRTGLRRRMYTEKPRQKGIPCSCIAPVARQGRHGIITVYCIRPNSDECVQYAVYTTADRRLVT